MKKIFLVLLTVIFLISCDKDDPFINLKATMSIDNVLVGAKEGSSLVYTFRLDEPLSKDLILEGEFSTEGIVNYINDDDYKHELEYSADGREWKKEKNTKQIKFVAGTSNLTVRIKTVDDDKLEFLEEKGFLKFKIVKGDQFSITNKISDLTFLVFDNDEGEVRRTNMHEVFIFKYQEDGTFKIEDITDALENKLQKELIDGAYKEPIKYVEDVNKLLPSYIKTEYFYMAATPSGDGGAVQNFTTMGPDYPNTWSDKEWMLMLNVAWAYYDLDKMLTDGKFEFDDGYKLNSFDEKGALGYVTVHEMAHLLTLNLTKQFEPTEYSPEAMGTCNMNGGFGIPGGCSKNDNSYLYSFNKNYYDLASLKEPQFVSPYSESAIEEDIAETFAQFVIQDNIPVATNESSGALQKINFIKDRPIDFASLKSDLKAAFKPSFVSPDRKQIFEYQVNKDGKHMSCLDKDRNWGAIKEE